MKDYSLPQIQVIKKLRQGYELSRHSHYLKCTLLKGQHFETIQYSTVNVLLKHKLITFTRIGLEKIQYFLTEEGLTTKL